MKRFILFPLLICLAFSLQAQKKAVTETGEQVVLYDDGTWEYVDKPGEEETQEIKLNPGKFVKGEESDFQIKSENLNVGFWINPDKWEFTKETKNNPDAEYELSYKEGDLYSFIITEGIEIPLANLKDIAVNNAKKGASGVSVEKQEYRMVNGIKVLCLKMSLTFQGIDAIYYSYYYSNENGTVQFVTATSSKKFDEYKEECEKLLNGLVEL